MSGGFSFPPPPPPPPSNDPPENQWQANTTPRGRGGRGGRGRGQRGRGRGACNEFSSSGHHAATGTHHPTFSQLPAGSHVNPNFAQGQPRPPVQYGQRDTITRTATGHKRKLDALRGPEKKMVNGPPIAPAVPSFGAPLTSVPVSNTGLKSRGNALGLTPASESVPQYPSSDDDGEDEDNDEEAAHAELGTKLTFEHNGEILALNTAADIAKWQNERRRKFPTSARIAEKEVAKVKTGEERRRLLAAASESLLKARIKPPNRAKREVTTALTSSPDTQLEETELQKAKRSLSEKTAEVERLRQKVTSDQQRIRRAQEAQADIAAKTPVVSLLDATYDESESSEVLSESSVVSSDSSIDEESDEAPEETTTKPAMTPQSKGRPCRYFVASGHCRDGDSCQFHHDSTIRAREARKERERTLQSTTSQKRGETAASRKGIFDRLVQQEQEEMDRLALKVIKYLGETGLFHDVGASE